ncbi:hypothetical protein [Pleionea sediminis]|uniref:hypothetical protein n=1 Tax=Pleionea sediminis TaxID=2569479 RepID=UPI0011849DA4|nr:hypothetical protein [Pleionea sediminis]
MHDQAVMIEPAHIKVEIKEETAIISGVVSQEEYKGDVATLFGQLNGIKTVKNYLCVIAPFKPFTRIFGQNIKSKIDDDSIPLVTVTQIRKHPDDFGHVIYHNTLTRAQEFFRHNLDYVVTS